MSIDISAYEYINIYYDQNNYYYETESFQSMIFSFPIFIRNLNNDSTSITVKLMSDIPINDSNFYIICESPNIIFDGNSYKITINGIIDYLGFIQNGSSNNDGWTNINIKNFSIESNLSTLSYNAGWLVQNYFSKGSSNECSITNCSVIGNLTNDNSGGICGAYSGSNSSILTITNCYVIGDINGIFSGGICGTYSGSNYGNINISNSYSTGNIYGSESGGICGSSCGSGGGNITIINCYSTGNINGQNAGGICGSNCGSNSGNATIRQCYSTGNINGFLSGGICGICVGKNGGISQITYCYTLGNIVGSNAGGICGSSAGVIEPEHIGDISNILVEYCFSLGNILGDYSGGIYGGSAGYGGGNCTARNCYSRGNVISMSAGGIYGSGAGGTSITICCIASNCYSSGTLSNELNGIFTVDSELSAISIQYCYVAFGLWVDFDAFNNLEPNTTPTYINNGNNLICPIGSVWTDVSNLNNIPWVFSSFGDTPYLNPNSIVNAGNSTQTAIKIININYQIVAIKILNSEPVNPTTFNTITINLSNGQISTTTKTLQNLYVIYIYALNNDGSYSTSEFFLTVVINNLSFDNCIGHKYKVFIEKNKTTKIKFKNTDLYYYNYKYKIIKKPIGKIHKFNKYDGKIIYTPPYNFVGKTYIEYIGFIDNVQVTPINKLVIYIK